MFFIYYLNELWLLLCSHLNAYMKLGRILYNLLFSCLLSYLNDFQLIDFLH